MTIFVTNGSSFEKKDTNKKLEEEGKKETIWHEIQWILTHTCGYSDEAAHKITDFIHTNYQPKVDQSRAGISREQKILEEFRKKLIDYLSTLPYLEKGGNPHAVKQHETLESLLSFFFFSLSKYRQSVLGEVIEYRPFVDLTRDWTERQRIKKYLDIWEECIKKLNSLNK